MSEDNLDDLIAAEIDADEQLSLDGDEFLAMMEERGLIIPRGPTLLQRVWKVVAYPLRRISSVVSFVVWHLGGKAVYRHRLEKQKRRMQQLAGMDSKPNPRVQELERISRERQRLEYFHGTPATAQAQHEHIIKTKIVREELPKPDFDDGGLN